MSMENLTSVSEQYICTKVLQKKIFAKLKGLSLWKVGWGRVGPGQVGAGPTYILFIFYFFLVDFCNYLLRALRSFANLFL